MNTNTYNHISDNVLKENARASTFRRGVKPFAVAVCSIITGLSFSPEVSATDFSSPETISATVNLGSIFNHITLKDSQASGL
ncbi:MAG: hypothetical protein J6M93_01565 [Succinivibrio sp.]|nr:hypothetical protein [Succinivibrio sp.]